MGIALASGPADGGLGLPVCRAAALDAQEGRARWLVEHLWAEQAVGIVGGAPKSCKSWLGLDLAVSVASGTPCLDRFPVHSPGPALVYLAEDALPLVRERIAGLCEHRHVALDPLDLYVITAADLRLDQERDRDRLETTLAELRPRLLVLDPLVRLHRLDENSAGELSGLLGFLRRLQRTHGTAIALVHHMGKKGRTQLGQALRGSGDLFAFGDSYAYLTRARGQLWLSLEHRAAPAPEPIAVELRSEDDGAATHLAVTAGPPTADEAGADLANLVLDALRRADASRTRAALRNELHVNNLRLGDTLLALERSQRIRRLPDGWRLATPPEPDPAAAQLSLP